MNCIGRSQATKPEIFPQWNSMCADQQYGMEHCSHSSLSLNPLAITSAGIMSYPVIARYHLAQGNHESTNFRVTDFLVCEKMMVNPII